MIVGNTREETIRLTSDTLGISVEEAELIYAIEHGETDGDATEENEPA